MIPQNYICILIVAMVYPLSWLLSIVLTQQQDLLHTAREKVIWYFDCEKIVNRITRAAISTDGKEISGIWNVLSLQRSKVRTK